MTESDQSRNSDREVLPHSVFMISPIGGVGTDIRRHADMVLNSIVRQALRAPEFIVSRADDTSVYMITDKIISAIEEAPLCVCDLSFHNPNVFYELGLRHALEKPVILIANEGTVLPFDTSGFPTIFYNVLDWDSHVTTRAKIFDAAHQMLATDYKVSNPITQARRSVNLSKSTDPTDRLVSDLLMRVQVLETNHSRLIELNSDQSARTITAKLSSSPGPLSTSLSPWLAWIASIERSDPNTTALLRRYISDQIVDQLKKSGTDSSAS